MSSKAPAFQWYAADYLADERVMLMTLEAEGAYVRLLSLCWREGSIPANTALLAAMCKQADQKVIKEVLPCFTKVGAPSGRLVHKRLEEERAKQLAHRTKQAENGRNGGRPKKAVGKPNETQKNPPLSVGETQTEPNESSSFISSTSISSNDDSAQEPSSLPAEELEVQPLEAKPTAQPELAAAADPAKAAAIANTDPAEEQHWSIGPLTKPVPFKVICERLGHLGIDFEYYRRVALVAAEDKNDSRTIIQWTSWIRNFFTNQLKTGPLLKPTDGEAARTGVHAPQFEGGYQHQVRAEVQAERDRERQQNINLRIAANLAKHAAEGQQHQANPIGGAGRPPGA